MTETRLVGPRYKYPVSDAELNRRLNALQTEMKKEDIDCYIAHTDNDIYDSVIRYMIDNPIDHKGAALLVPSEGLMTFVRHGADDDNAPVPPTIRNVEKLIVKPYCQTMGCTDTLLGEALVKEIKAKGFKKIGLVMKQMMSTDLAEYLYEHLPDAEFVDFTKTFSKIAAVKSAEELLLADRSVRAHEHLIDTVPSLLRPGRFEYEIIADLESRSRYMGCDFIGNIAVGSVPRGQAAFFYNNFNAKRCLEHGDIITVMIEVSGPGGIYGEVARTYSLGEPPNQSLVDLFEISKNAQYVLAEAMKPGITGKELNQIYNDFVVPLGIAENSRFVAHSQGYDMMEAPTICPTEDMVIEENMFFAIHPEVVKNGEYCVCCDNFVVTKDGAVRKTRTKQEVIHVEY